MRIYSCSLYQYNICSAIEFAFSSSLGSALPTNRNISPSTGVLCIAYANEYNGNDRIPTDSTEESPRSSSPTTTNIACRPLLRASDGVTRDRRSTYIHDDASCSCLWSVNQWQANR